MFRFNNKLKDKETHTITMIVALLIVEKKLTFYLTNNVEATHKI